MMDVDLATNSFGQNLNVTMTQMVATFASLINGGYYYQPHVVKQILSESGEPVKTINPTLVTQTVSSDTSHTMREMMRAVVDYGTGGYVHMDGYSIGGKTGTAEKAGRDKTEYVISFMGFAPAENPEVLVYVVIDTPDCEEYNTSWSAQVLARAMKFRATGGHPAKRTFQSGISHNCPGKYVGSVALGIYGEFYIVESSY